MKARLTTILRGLAKKVPGVRARVLYGQARRALGSGEVSQSNEGAILDRFTRLVDCPKTFCEFGFNPKQFNCGGLMRTGYRGLLIDGDELATSVARRVFKDLAFSETTVWTKFLTLDNLADIEVFFHGRDLGVLSVDVDGNDYWFLERLIRLRPWIVVVEYNASFGTACISVPYDPAFRRHEKHSTGWYHGASMKALTLLCSKAGYSLVDVSEDGINVFFMRNDVKPDDVATLDADAAFRENALRNVWSGSRVADQWARIEHLPYRKLDPTPP